VVGFSYYVFVIEAIYDYDRPFNYYRGRI